ncbi:MAG TPA: ImmA/IrrE family metallo-endopeptidase [Candidatus Latescibacteria bacterium]|nr:ImmA/IrrE family metallo-endopeptidase [Candidatus Latescibacterota bacterium]
MTPREYAHAQYRLTDITQAPVDLVPIIRHHQLRIVEVEVLDRADSRLQLSNTAGFIRIRRDIDHTRKRWEIARQIGLFVMLSEGERPRVRDTSVFASELLMPAELVVRLYRNRREWLKNAMLVGMSATKRDMIRGLSWQFEVDDRAIAIRLDELHLGPGAGPNKRVWSSSPGVIPRWEADT